MSSVDYVGTNNVVPQGWSVSQWHLTRTINPPMHPAAMNKKMPNDYTLPDGRTIEHVTGRPPHLSPPQDSGTIPPITFSVNGWPGVRVRDILKRGAIVDGANDAVLAHLGWRSIVVNLKWPGYECRSHGDPMLSRMDVQPCGMAITRQKLARDICELLSSFREAVCDPKKKYHISPECEKWALTAGQEGIRPDDVVLFSVHYYRNTWVPEFYVLV